MMFSIPDKPKVCPVCGSEPSSKKLLRKVMGL